MKEEGLIPNDETVKKVVLKFAHMISKELDGDF